MSRYTEVGTRCKSYWDRVVGQNLMAEFFTMFSMMFYTFGFLVKVLVWHLPKSIWYAVKENSNEV